LREGGQRLAGHPSAPKFAFDLRTKAGRARHILRVLDGEKLSPDKRLTIGNA